MLSKGQAETLSWKIIASFPSTAEQADSVIKILQAQLTTLLTGVSQEDAEAVIHPQVGLPGQFQYPSAFNLNKWLEKRRRVPSVPLLSREDHFTPPTDEEKERAAKMVSAFKASVALDKKMRPARHCGPARTDPDKLLEALRHHELANPGKDYLGDLE